MRVTKLLRQTASKSKQFLRTLTHKRYLIFAGIGLVVLCVAITLWPRHVAFSYKQKACIMQPLLLPGLLKSTSDSFRLDPDRQVKIGSFVLASGGICATPIKSPQKGDHSANLALFGFQLIGKRVTLTVGEPPQASVAAIERPIPVMKPLVVPLSETDKVFSYKMTFNDKTLACKNTQQTVTCDIARFNLAQGTKYALRMDRYFANKKVQTVLSKEITTLSGVSVSDSSIKTGEMVFAKPKTLDLRLDKALVAAEVTVVRVDGDKKQVAAQASVDGPMVNVRWEDDLARQASYELRLTKVEATDGSNLIEPYTLPFKTSGGPKVKAVSVGTSRVPLGTMATITFDQPVSDKQDLAKIITLGGGAVLAGHDGARVMVNLAGVPKCGAATIKISDELQSNYDVTGGSAWSYATRMLCYTLGSIGTSAGGRAISAYYFGSGPNAVIYTGAIHGSEGSTRSLMLRWIDDLEANPGSIPADKSVVVVPAINPDGIARGARLNNNGIDLNRNFGTSDWRKDITTVTNAPFPGGGGPSPMSEPETRAIAGLVGRLSPQLVLSYHSIGGVVIANQAGISNARAGTYVNLSGYGNATGSSTTFEYSISGTADDYYAEKFGVASLVIELGSHTYHQFDRNQKAMWAMLR